MIKDEARQYFKDKGLDYSKITVKDIEKAKNQLIDLKIWLDDNKEHEGESIEAIDVALHALQNQLNGGWIPVSERLPDNQQRVIVKCKGCPTVIGWIMHGRWHTDFGCMYKEYDVIEWQPLPEPWKEVVNE